MSLMLLVKSPWCIHVFSNHNLNIVKFEQKEKLIPSKQIREEYKTLSSWFWHMRFENEHYLHFMLHELANW